MAEHAGAADVGSITLTASNWTGHSAVASGSDITGDLGTMTLVKDSGGYGGFADGFTVAGDVTGNVTLPKGAGFTVVGQIGVAGGGATTLAVEDITDGYVTIGSLVDAAVDVTAVSGTSSYPAGVWVKNGAASSSIIEITTMGAYATVKIGDQVSVDADAWINLSSGVPLHSMIDLSMADMTGYGITLGGGTYYDLAGEIYVGVWNGEYLLVDDVSGTLRFNRIESGPITVFGAVTGLIDVNDDLAGGTLQVRGDLSGNVTIDDDLAGGLLEIKGDQTGDITIGDDVIGGELEVEGAVSGDITITDDFNGATGLLDLQGALTGTVRVGGDFTAGGVTVNSVGGAGQILTLGSFNGGASSLSVTTTMSGIIDVVGAMTAGEIDLAGNVSGTLSVGSVSGTALLDLHNPLSGTIQVDGAFSAGTLNVGSVDAAGDLLVGGNYSGTTNVSGAASGTIDVDGAMTGGEIDIGGAVSGPVSIASMSAGLVDLHGTVSSAITIEGVMSGGEVQVRAPLSGSVNIDDDMSGGMLDLWDSVGGDVDVAGQFDGTIAIAGSLSSSGHILFGELMNGTLTIATSTVKYSLIHMEGGFDDEGVITINGSEGNYDAVGNIHVGPISYLCGEPCEMPPVTYDGCLQVLDNGAGGYGDLRGDVTVVGCHRSNDDLGITIQGNDVFGSITIIQTDCANQVTWSSCPP